MSAITRKIRLALQAHLVNTPAPALPTIDYDNVRFDQEPGVPYIQAQFAQLARRPAVRGPDPEHRYSGIFLLTVCTPENSGPTAGEEVADQLQERFNGASSIQGVDVNVSIEYSEAEMGYHRPPFYCIPVRVGWYCYA